jgi:hypothetical protein
MWTDFNTKPKQGATCREFRSHMMDIPVDYYDITFKAICYNQPPENIAPINRILSIPKDKKVLQECVGGQQSDVADQMSMAEPGHAAKQMAEPGDVAKAGHVAKQMAEPGDVARPPLKMVGGKPWSPGVYRSLQLLGNLVKVAWKQVFIRMLTFN